MKVVSIYLLVTLLILTISCNNSNDRGLKKQTENVFSEKDIEKLENIRFIKRKVKTIEEANAKIMGKSILQYASELCALSTVEYLVEKGADIDFISQRTLNNEVGSFGFSVMELKETPLILALGNDCWDVARFLIEHEANVDIHGSTLDNIGMIVVNNEIVPLCFAAKSGQFELVELMLSKKANVNAVESNGATALMCASETGNLDIAKILISNDANVNATDSKGETALMYASKAGNLDIVKILISNDANVNIDANGRNALYYALVEGHSKVEEILREAQELN